MCAADTVLDMLSSAAPLPPVRRHTENVKGSRGCLEYDHAPAHPGTATTPPYLGGRRHRSGYEKIQQLGQPVDLRIAIFDLKLVETAVVNWYNPSRFIAPHISQVRAQELAQATFAALRERRASLSISIGR